MSLLNLNKTPPEQHWDMLRNWRMHQFRGRYKMALQICLPIISLVVALAGVALLIVEPSLRTALWIAGLWVVGVPLAALGYVRKVDRLAANVPISPASQDPTTAVDIRRHEP